MNKKILALVLAFALVFSTFTAAFAAEALPADAQAAVTLGMLKGDTSAGVTSQYLATAPTRLQAAILFLRLKGLENAALAYSSSVNFPDANATLWQGGRNIMAYLKNHPELGWQGDNGYFKANDKMVAQAYYKVMLEALGYKQNSADVIGDFTYDQTIAFAASKGLTKVAGVTNFTVADVATATIEALKANVKGSTKTLATTLVEAGILNAQAAAAAGVYNPAPVALAVTGITTNNLKTMKIDLNKEIDPATVTTSTVKVTKASVDVVNNLYVSADNKSIVVEYTTAAQSDSLAVAINGVKTAAGEELKDYTATSTVIDTTIPQATGAVVLNQKQIEVSFNEPINFTVASFQVLNDVKMDGFSVIAKATPNFVKNSIVFEFPSVIAAGAHTFAIDNLADYVGFKAPAKEFTVAVGDDTTNPVLTSAVVKTKGQIEVTFSEKLDTVGTISVNGVEATVAPVANSNGTKYTLTNFGTLDLSALVEIKLAYSGQKDVAGNTVSTEQTFKFNAADDTTLPTVTAAIDADNMITLTFSKSMDTTVGAITVKDSDGTVLATLSPAWSFVSDSNNTVLEVSATAAGIDEINPENITVNVKNMKDASIRANLLPETNLTLAAKDSKNPTVNANYFVQAGTTAAADTVTFYFDEAMNAATLNNLSNYVGSTYGSLATVTGAKVKSVAADSKSVIITIPGVAANTTETFTVYALKDLAGNMIATTSGIAKLTSTALTAVAAESSDGVKVKVTFNTKLATVDPSALKIQKNDVDYAVFTNATIAADGMSATFTANKKLGTDMSVYTLVDLNKSLAKNIYNTSLSTIDAGLAIADKVAPTVTIATGDAAGQIKLTFSEAVKVTDLATLKSDLIIRDKNGALVNIDGTTVTATLSLGTGAGAYATGFDKLVIGGLTTGDNYTISLIGRNVKDLATPSNVILDLAAKTVAAK